MQGVVIGGSLWLTIKPAESDPTSLSRSKFQVEGDLNAALGERTTSYILQSPGGLNLGAGQWRLILRVLNLSAVTDLWVAWRSPSRPWGAFGGKLNPLNARRCSIVPDTKAWQEVICYLVRNDHEPIDQVGIFVLPRMRGDLWISRMELTPGPADPPKPRPVIASDDLVPRINLAGLSQEGFANAFRVLDRNVVADVPMKGFPYPFITPGGYYATEGWWELDTSIVTIAARWTNASFAEGVMRGFRAVQRLNPDGRIDLWGNSPVLGQVADQSQLPIIFQPAYAIARGSADESVRQEIYSMMKDYLDWWLSPVKRDARTGLVWATYEETFGEWAEGAHITGQDDRVGEDAAVVAPIDTNVAVAVGARYVSELAAELGRREDAQKYNSVFEGLAASINRYLWDETSGAYYNYDLKRAVLRPGLGVTTFDPLRLGIAPSARRRALLQKLVDPAAFNWDRRPLTSYALTDPGYIEAGGDYDGRQWFGDIWALRNMSVVQGLEECAEHQIAAELNWATIKEFHDQYREYLLPSTGQGQGAENYSWSAAYYIEAIIGHLLGIDYDIHSKEIRVGPHIPRELYGQEVAIENLHLPNAGRARLSVRVMQTSSASATIRVASTGTLPRHYFVVRLPGSASVYRAPANHAATFKFE
jgi:hypothetical protein